MSKYIQSSTIARIVLKLEKLVIYFYLENERRLLHQKQKSISPKSKEHIAFSSGQTNESIGPLGHMIQNIFHGLPWFQSQKTIRWHMNLLSFSHLLYAFFCSFFKAFCTLPNLLKFVHMLLILFFPWSLLLYSLYGSHASMHKIKV